MSHWMLPEEHLHCYCLQACMEDGGSLDRNEETGVLTLRDWQGQVIDTIQMVRVEHTDAESDR